jgi:hypothetical protein
LIGEITIVNILFLLVLRLSDTFYDLVLSIIGNPFNHDLQWI